MDGNLYRGISVSGKIVDIFKNFYNFLNFKNFYKFGNYKNFCSFENVKHVEEIDDFKKKNL